MKTGLVILVLSVFLASCASLKPEKPVEDYEPASVSLPASIINIPLDFQVADIEKMLNRQLQGLIYEDNDLNDNGGDNLMVKAWKKEDIKIALSDNTLTYRVPLKLWIKAGWKVSKFGLSVSDYKEMEGAIALKFSTAITLNPDWTFTTNTTSGGYEWLSTPVLKIGPVDVPITFIANLILKSNQKTINKEIDKAISGNLDLKKEMGSLWNVLQKPLEINEQYHVWIKVVPQEIYSTPFTGSGGKLRHTLGIKSIVTASIGNEPKSGSTVPLPSLKISDKMRDDFQLNLTTGIPFQISNELTQKYLQGKRFTQGKYTLLIDGIDLYGRKDKIIVHLLVSGSLKGDLYLEGVPFYNAESKSIQVKDMDYEIKTKNALAKSGSWLFHSTLINMLEKNMVFPLADQLNAAKKLLTDNLKEYKLTEDIILKETINDLNLGDIYLSREAINVTLILKGNVKVEMKR